MLPADAYRDLLKQLAPLLKSASFVRRGSTFYRPHQGNWGLIQFQRSMSNTRETVRFTANLGVASGRLRSFFHPSRAAIKPVWAECHWKVRIGFLLPEQADTWWTIKAETNLTQLREDLTAHLSNVAIPVIDQHLSDVALRDLWLTDRSPGLTEFQRLEILPFF